MRELRKLRRQQRQKLRHERRNPKNQGIPQQQQYHHRTLKLNEYDYSEEDDGGNYKGQNNVRFRHQFKGWKQSPRKHLMLPLRRNSPIERQTSIFAATPLLSPAGLVWFASLFGLAAMVREPLSTVFDGVNPWPQLFNGKYPVKT